MHDEFICPYCFSRVETATVGFRCACSRTPIPLPRPGWKGVLKKMVGMDNDISGVVCPQCSRRTTVPVCPRCDEDLPYGVTDIPSRMLAVIGGVDSGKSVYIALLIQPLNKRICGRSGRFSRFEFWDFCFGDESSAVVPWNSASLVRRCRLLHDLGSFPGKTFSADRNFRIPA